jgi:protein TonB
LAPTPDYTLGAKSKPAIVSGGTENTTYFSICNGLIMKQLKHTEYVRSSAGVATVFIAVDENGNLMHQALFKTSGFPDVDQDAMTAVRRAAPFPPPPRYLPTREFLFSLGVERGH